MDYLEVFNFNLKYFGESDGFFTVNSDIAPY